jgi:hypothetical protein
VKFSEFRRSIETKEIIPKVKEKRKFENKDTSLQLKDVTLLISQLNYKVESLETALIKTKHKCKRALNAKLDCAAVSLKLS